MAADMIYRMLGRTGQRVSAIGLGGWHLGLPKVSESDAIKIVRAAIDAGVTFMDNSWDYNDGASERRMGKALADGYRHRIFLMTKIDGRSRKEAMRQLDESLRRLRTDAIDLVQHHEILRFEDPHRIFDPDGGSAALVEAQRAGKLRFIGFTGHKDPRIHLYMLAVAREHRFRFDTAQMPLNVMDAHYRSFGGQVVPELVKEGIGVLGMKSMANGIILRSKRVTPIECLHFALNLPTSVVTTGVDSQPILDQALEAVRTFRPMDARVRAVQDVVDLRRDGGTPRVVRRRTRTDPAADAPRDEEVRSGCAAPGTAGFGSITSTSNNIPRQVQFAAKLLF